MNILHFIYFIFFNINGNILIKFIASLFNVSEL